MDIQRDENYQKTVYKDDSTQQELNTPLKDDSGLSDEDQIFLNSVLSMVEDGSIDLYKPETLINQEVYGALDDKLKGAADLEAVNILASIRELKDLKENGFENTFQMKNLVERVHNTKKRIEQEKGDIFII